MASPQHRDRNPEQTANPSPQERVSPTSKHGPSDLGPSGMKWAALSTLGYGEA